MIDPESTRKVNELVERTKDRVMAAESNLLNALLSVNGFFIGAASIVVAVRPGIGITRCFFSIVITCCSASMLLVVWNYYSGRKILRNMGLSLASMQQTLQSGENLEESEVASFATQIKDAQIAYDQNGYREAICFALLAITVVAFAIFLTE